MRKIKPIHYIIYRNVTLLHTIQFNVLLIFREHCRLADFVSQRQFNLQQSQSDDKAANQEDIVGTAIDTNTINARCYQTAVRQTETIDRGEV